jgi:hypothetical protein
MPDEESVGWEERFRTNALCVLWRLELIVSFSQCCGLIGVFDVPWPMQLKNANHFLGACYFDDEIIWEHSSLVLQWAPKLPSHSAARVVAFAVLGAAPVLLFVLIFRMWIVKDYASEIIVERARLVNEMCSALWNNGRDELFTILHLPLDLLNNTYISPREVIPEHLIG